MSAENLILEDHMVDEKIAALKQAFNKLLPEKKDLSEALLACLLAQGHVLLEDVPGVGKTTFIKGLAQILGLDMQRVQFTADLLPADILGIEIFDSHKQDFRLHKGPIFTNILLADELNRASPKTQSALLEAMGEGHVSIDRKTWKLPTPFFVLAAQNPSDHAGTFVIPESQLDRFSLKLKLGYPDEKQERAIFAEAALDPLAALPHDLISASELQLMQRKVESVKANAELVRCLHSVVLGSRNHEQVSLGISTRGGIQWMRLAKALALIANRNFVIPDDLIALANFCLPHRMIFKVNESEAVIADLMSKMDI